MTEEHPTKMYIKYETTIPFLKIVLNLFKRGIVNNKTPSAIIKSSTRILTKVPLTEIKGNFGYKVTKRNKKQYKYLILLSSQLKSFCIG